jgi:signal peptidase II
VTLTRRQGLLLVAGAFAFVVAADQLTKLWILYNVPLGRFPAVSPTFFHITYQRNYGLVIGLFGDTPVVARVAPVVATFVLAYLYRYLHPHSIVQNAAFGMVAGGAIGNLIDRFRLGYVVDFLQFDFYFLPDWLPLPTTRYPAFNVADSAICVGVAILIFTWHRMASEESGESRESEHAPDAD